MTMRLYFARHAESEANIQNIISDCDLFHPLTERGREQAYSLGERLVEADITGIFCSPILRARETAGIVSQVIGAPVAVADGLREFDAGVLEGRADDDAWREMGKAILEWLEHGDLDYRIPEGESCNDVIRRFTTLIRQIIHSGVDGNYLFISHNGAMRVSLPVLFTNLPAELYQEKFLDFTDVVVANVVEGDLVCVEWRGQLITK